MMYIKDEKRHKCYYHLCRSKPVKKTVTFRNYLTILTRSKVGNGYFFWLNLISSMIRPISAIRKIPNCNMILISTKRRLLSKDLIDTVIGITLLILRLATIVPTCLHLLLYRCKLI